MRKLLSLTLLFTLMVVAFAQPTIPTKLFDVRNGNGVVDSGVTYPNAIVIPFKDAAAKTKTVDAIATAYGYQATIPDPVNPGQTIANPQSKAAFANKQIAAYLRDNLESVSLNTAAEAARKTAKTASDAELPDK